MKIDKITPEQGYILIEKIKEETITKSGFTLNQEDKTKTCAVGKVISVNENDHGLPYVGEENVIYRIYAADSFPIEDKEYLFVKKEDVLGRIQE